MDENMYSSKKNRTERVLVCLSSAPSNTRVVRTAAKMAQAFNATFTALFVQTSQYEQMQNFDKDRLKYNSDLARQSGATLATVYGDDIAYRISEYARLSGVTKIVIGHSNTPHRNFFSSQTLTEKLVEIASGRDIYIIPDNDFAPYRGKKRIFTRDILPSARDLLKTSACLLMATIIGLMFWKMSISEDNIITIYILGALITSIYTKGYLCSVTYSLLSVLRFDFFFTQPYYTFHVHSISYLFTFTVMLMVSLISGTLANRLKHVAKQSTQSAYRTKVLLDTNQLLHKAADDTDIITICATQIMKLLGRNVIEYSENNGHLTQGKIHFVKPENTTNIFQRFDEGMAAHQAFRDNCRTGVTTEHFSHTNGMYLPISLNNSVYGVIGIEVRNTPLDSFENSIVLSILGECALSIENSRNVKEKELAAEKARAEQLRANILRTISHDLRTPLTSISGNADNLISNYSKMDSQQIKQSFEDIYNDSQWLINIVENLLSVTRIEEKGINLNMSDELIEELIVEAVAHVNRKRHGHNIIATVPDNLLMARMDARLIIQVIVNLIDNAIKYTPQGTDIHISTHKAGGMVHITVADNGPGIDGDYRQHVFEMFHTGNKKVADGRRSLGLGLALCRSIVNAHGGEITLTDNVPSGCVFDFTLPSREIHIYE